MASIDSLTFDTSGLQTGPEETNRKVWYTAEGDGISLNFFDKPPDLPPGMRWSVQVRDFYLVMLQSGPARLVESEIARLGDCPAIRLIIKVPQEPSGMTYVGSFTIPFRDFSFVVKCQCMENGITGAREAILFERLNRSKTFFSRWFGRKHVNNWNPDSPDYDADFPWHPLSRLRKVLGRIENSTVIEPEVLTQPPFPLSAALPSRRDA